MKQFPFVALAILVHASVFAQNMGIGTTNPTRARLEVVGVSGAGNTSAIFGSDGAGVSLQTNWPTVGFNQYRDQPTLNGKYMASGYSVIMYLDPSSGFFAIDNQNTGALNTNTVQGVRAITVSNLGRVGIRYGALDNNSASLTVGRGEGVNGTVQIAGYNHNSHFNYATNEDTYIRANSDNSSVVVNSIPNGNILIGSGSTMVGFGISSDPTATIHLNCSSSWEALGLTDVYGYKWGQKFSCSGALSFTYGNPSTGLGSFSSSSGVYSGSSDRSLKQDIRPMEPVLQKVKSLNAVSYEMVDHNPQHRRSIGFIAQEVKPLFPSQVHVVDDHARSGERHKDLHTMNYSGFNVIAVKALQEQWQQIKALQEEQEQLITQLQKLNSQLDEQIAKGNK